MSKPPTTTPYDRPAFFGLCVHCQTERALNGDKRCERCEQQRRIEIQNVQPLTSAKEQGK